MALLALERTLAMVDATGHRTARRAPSILLPVTPLPASLRIRRSRLFLCSPDRPVGCRPGREAVPGEIQR
jgi:hypothetical protein